MPTAQHRFPTPEPITLRLRNHAGSVEIVAAATTETTVQISGAKREPAHVELSPDGRTLTVEPQRDRLIHRHRLDMVVHLPAGSRIHADTAAASIEVRGSVADLEVSTASGRVSAEVVEGPVEVGTASGSAKIGDARSAVAFRSASGSLHVDRSGGDCTARTASGSVTIGLADGDVTASSVSGHIRVQEAHRGSLDVSSTSGSVAVGVRRGTLVWLDVSSVAGRTRSDLTEEPAAEPGGSPLSLRAHTVSGSIAVTPTGAAAIPL